MHDHPRPSLANPRTPPWLALLGLLVALGHGGADTPYDRPALKLGVEQEGLYRLTGSALAQAGMPTQQVDPRSLQLFEGGEPVSLQVTGEQDGKLDGEDALLFYGRPPHSPYTRTNVYWLTWGDEPGQRWPERSVAPAGGPITTSARWTRVWEENRRYGRLMYVTQPGPIPHWFWELVPAGKSYQASFELDDLAPQQQPPGLEVVLWGNTLSFTENPDHHTRLLLNGHLLEDARWDGQTEHRLRVEVDPAWLLPGHNELTIECPGDTAAGEVDQVFLDRFALTYEHRLSSKTGTLVFPTPSDDQLTFQVGEWEGGAPLLLELGHPRAPVALSGAQIQEGALTFSDRCPAGSRYLIGSLQSARAPVWVQVDTPSQLRQQEGVDYLIIAHDDLVAAVEPLAEWRRREGLQVRVARVSDVYDEFSHGLVDPRALREYVRFVYHQTPRRLRFLLLVGDATYDYQDFLGTGVRNYIPPYLARTRDSLDTAVDDWFACVEGDDHLPEVAVGRIPADRPEEVATLVAKTIAYEQLPDGQPWQRRLLFIADHDVSHNYATWYERVNERLAQQATRLGYQPVVLTLRSALFAEPPTPVRPALTQQVLATLQSGCALVEFQGHGREGYWSREKVLTLEDVAQLSNGPHLPVVMDVSCFTAWFDYPQPEGHGCMAEAFLFLQNGGAAAYVGPARLGGMNFDLAFWEGAWQAGRLRLGELVAAAKRPSIHETGEFWDPVSGYNLMGDPALVLKLASARAPTAPEPQPTLAVAEPSAPAAEPARLTLAEGLAAVPSPAKPAERPQRQIRLRGRVINPAEVPSDIPDRLDTFQLPPDSPVCFVVQPAEPMNEQNRSALEQAGVRVLQEVPDGALLVRITCTQARQLAQRPEIAWVGLYTVSDRLAPGLLGRAMQAAGPLELRVELFSEESVPTIRSALEGWQGRFRDISHDQDRTVLRISLPALHLLDLARMQEVAWIEEVTTAGDSPAASL